MVPFLVPVPDLRKLVKDLLAHFVQRDVVESLVTCSDVIGFDTNDIGKHCPAIELGFSADKIIRSDNFKKKKVSDRDMLGIRTDAKSVLKAMCKKLLQKTPITYPVARALSCLDSRNIAGSPEQCKTMMRRLLSACVEGGFVVEADCDEVMQQFDDFIHMCAKGDLENFCVADDRLDAFLRSRMAANCRKACL